MDAPYLMRRAGVRAWLRDLYTSLLRQKHGSELIDAMVDGAGGRYFTGPSDADDCLRWMESEGWIMRAACNPTPSQAAWLGLSMKRIDRIYASCWWWLVPEDANSPGRIAAETWLKGQD